MNLRLQKKIPNPQNQKTQQKYGKQHVAPSRFSSDFGGVPLIYLISDNLDLITTGQFSVLFPFGGMPRAERLV